MDVIWFHPTIFQILTPFFLTTTNFIRIFLQSNSILFFPKLRLKLKSFKFIQKKLSSYPWRCSVFDSASLTSDPSSIYQPKILAALYVLFDTNALSQIYTFSLHAICRPNSKMDQCNSCMLLQMCYLRSHLLLPAKKPYYLYTRIFGSKHINIWLWCTPFP